MQLDLKDAASIFSVPEKVIHLWIKQKDMPAYQVGGQYRFNRAELLEWATEREVGVAAEIMSKRADTEFQPPRLDEALKRGGICHHVEGKEKGAVLRAVVDVMPVPQDVDRSFLYEMLLARESLGSTAIGDSIAIPHVRHPIVLHIPHPTVTLCFLDHPVDFGAVDGKPVDILFTLVSPTVRAHQHLLSKLAFALKNPQFRAVLTRKGPGEEVIGEAARVEETLTSQLSHSHS
jgi:PTS system nitrogen regulatory IIA component